jgi:Cu(I)/Ag(I) efflux system protein CusF
VKKLLVIILALSSFSVSADEWTKGEIRRVDIDTKRVTIKHEEIKNLDMPPMSMVFYVENAEILKGINPGDQIEFEADQRGSRYFVKQFRKIK